MSPVARTHTQHLLKTRRRKEQVLKGHLSVSYRFAFLIFQFCLDRCSSAVLSSLWLSAHHKTNKDNSFFTCRPRRSRRRGKEREGRREGKLKQLGQSVRREKKLFSCFLPFPLSSFFSSFCFCFSHFFAFFRDVARRWCKAFSSPPASPLP